jgi:hypothetical protein
MKYTTTLKQLRDSGACADRYNHLKKAGKYNDESIIHLSEILEHNGLEDAIWALRSVVGVDIERDARLFACDCAAQSLKYFEVKYPDDKRPRKSIQAARRYAKKPTSINKSSMDAARDAARAAADAARDAARAAADAAWDAAWAAADAAWDAAWAAAAEDAAEEAWAAAKDAAWAAARAAKDAAWAAAAEDAAEDAWAAAKEKQEQLYIKYFCTE